MDVQEILHFYIKNGLYNSKHKYHDKIKYLEWFYFHDLITIDVITDYCTHRSLEGVKNSTINREINLMRAAFNYYLTYNHTANFKNPFNRFRLFENDYVPTEQPDEDENEEDPVDPPVDVPPPAANALTVDFPNNLKNRTKVKIL